MLKNKLSTCICGELPRLYRRRLTGIGSIFYYFYSCNKCGIDTFSTREKEFCLELWNSTIKRKIKNYGTNK